MDEGVDSWNEWRLLSVNQEKYHLFNVRPVLMLPDPVTHGRVFAGVLALPPIEIMQVAAEGQWSAFNGGDGNTIMDWGAAFTAYAGSDELRRNGAMPGDTAIALVVDS